MYAAKYEEQLIALLLNCYDIFIQISRLLSIHLYFIYDTLNVDCWMFSRFNMSIAYLQISHYAYILNIQTILIVAGLSTTHFQKYRVFFSDFRPFRFRNRLSEKKGANVYL